MASGLKFRETDVLELWQEAGQPDSAAGSAETTLGGPCLSLGAGACVRLRVPRLSSAGGGSCAHPGCRKRTPEMSPPGKPASAPACSRLPQVPFDGPSVGPQASGLPGCRGGSPRRASLSRLGSLEVSAPLVSSSPPLGAAISSSAEYGKGSSQRPLLQELILSAPYNPVLQPGRLRVCPAELAVFLERPPARPVDTWRCAGRGRGR